MIPGLLLYKDCLLYTSDAAEERPSVDLVGPRIFKKKKHIDHVMDRRIKRNQIKIESVQSMYQYDVGVKNTDG